MPSRSLQSRSLQPPIICGQRFKEKRESLGWSIEELVEKTTFSKNQVAQIENGLSNAFYSEHIKFKSAQKVAEVLNLSMDVAFEVRNTHSNLTNINPPEKEDPYFPWGSENPKPVLVNNSIIENNSPSQEFEKAKAHIKLKLKILVFSFVFLMLLFITQDHDLFSTFSYFQPTR